jgi:hypothetical protein
MFVRHYVDLPVPAEQVERLILGDPAAWLPSIAGQATDHAGVLLAEVGVESGRLTREVRVDVGEPVRLEGSVLLPVTWRAARLEALFPVLEADLQVAAVGPRRTQLSLNGRYQPPLGAVGRALDRTLLHRIAEATVRDFLERVAARVGERTGSLSG